MDGVCSLLAPALSSRETNWVKIEEPQSGRANGDVGSLAEAAAELRRVVQSRARPGPPFEAFETGRTVLTGSRNTAATVFIPTAEPPSFALLTGELSAGRRLMSDDLAMLEAVALIVARRIDALRITHERCEQSLREQEISKLATEAELRALRAQINPHFLFNALTTIGYLIQAAPDRALGTLMRLTELLRSVLHSGGEFVTLGEEIGIIQSYLEIERARFEERLRISFDIPETLRGIRIPALLIQPLVENAIKHGIGPCRDGGDVMVSARVEGALGPPGPAAFLCITVRDTGNGVSDIDLANGRRRGLGISNIELRLRSHFGPAARLVIQSAQGLGTIVEARLPLSDDPLSNQNLLFGPAQRRRA
jgi:hypothetical protein